MKKFFKIFGIIVLVLILLLVSIPFLFKNTIKEKIMEKVNESVNAQISFTDFSLSVFKNFPNATLTMLLLLETLWLMWGISLLR